MMNKRELKHDELKAEAVKLFAIHPNIKQLYMTARGQAFTEKHRAEAEVRYLKDKNVYVFDRFQTPELEEPTPDNREELLQEYEELFGKPAPHNISKETLAKKIAEEKENKVESNKKEK